MKGSTMRVSAALLTAALLASPAIFPGAALAQNKTFCGQTYDGKLETLQKRVRGMPFANTQKAPTGDFEVISLPSQGEVWYFTNSTHAANPAAACRKVVVVEGVPVFKTLVECQAAKAACDKLSADYAAQDKKANDANAAAIKKPAKK